MTNPDYQFIIWQWLLSETVKHYLKNPAKLKWYQSKLQVYKQ